MFHVRPRNYWMNHEEAQLLHAGEATIEKPSGEKQPAVALFHAGYVKFVLNSTEGRRIAEEILNKLEVSENIHNTEGVTS